MSAAADLPAASAVAVSPAAEAPEPVEMDALLTSLKTLDAPELFKVMKAALTEAEKRTKSGTKRRAAPTSTKKAGSMPKGVVPPQLRKPRAWVEFVLAHALQNGWESFTVHQTRKDKETGEKIEEEIEMPASILHDGAYVYEGSVTEKQPAGKQLIQKDAMSLSKQYWAPKEKKGTRPDLYEEFENSYVEEAVEASETASTASTATKVVKKTAAEKEAEAAAKKEQKEREKEEKKAQREKERADKKAAADAEKAEKKAAAAAEKAKLKAEKEAGKKPAAKGPVPAAAVKKAAPAAPVKAAAAAPAAAAAGGAGAKAPVKKAPVAAAKKEEWSCPADGMVHPWSFKGKKYLRNSDNEVWLAGADGGCGEWQGVYLPAEDRIDDSVPEPEFEDEE